MAKIILTLFLVALHLNSRGQEPVIFFIEKVNAQLLSIEKGTYSVYYKYKSFFEADTTTGNGKVQYFKTKGGPGDSIARFTFWSSNATPQGFDGTLFWTVNHEHKQVFFLDPAQRKGIQDYISHYNSDRNHILSVPILTNKGYAPLNPFDFEGWDMVRYQLNDTLFVALSKSSYVPNKQKVAPMEGDSILITEQWLFFPDVYMPRRKRLIADRGNGLVYFDEINYSIIQSLPDSLESTDVSGITTLIQQGYQVVEKTALITKSVHSLSIGDSIPDFMLRREEGDTLPLFMAFNQRYLVLDFWYRACAPCNLAMPGLDRTAKAIADKDVAIVCVNPFDKQFDNLLNMYKKQFGYAFHLAFADKAVTEQLKIKAYPTLVVVDNQTRKVIHVANGYLEEAEQALRQFLEGLQY